MERISFCIHFSSLEQRCFSESAQHSINKSMLQVSIITGTKLKPTFNFMSNTWIRIWHKGGNDSTNEWLQNEMLYINHSPMSVIEMLYTNLSTNELHINFIYKLLHQWEPSAPSVAAPVSVFKGCWINGAISITWNLRKKGIIICQNLTI